MPSTDGKGMELVTVLAWIRKKSNKIYYFKINLINFFQMKTNSTCTYNDNPSQSSSFLHNEDSSVGATQSIKQQMDCLSSYVSHK